MGYVSSCVIKRVTCTKKDISNLKVKAKIKVCEEKGCMGPAERSQVDGGKVDVGISDVARKVKPFQPIVQPISKSVCSACLVSLLPSGHLHTRVPRTLFFQSKAPPPPWPRGTLANIGLRGFLLSVKLDTV
jgi:hypothetical protein